MCNTNYTVCYETLCMVGVITENTFAGLHQLSSRTTYWKGLQQNDTLPNITVV